jgi:peptidoglycan/LPS O-acetylase OafA/YrhL
VHLAALLAIFPIALFSPNLPLDWRAVPFHLLLAQCFWPLSHPSFQSYLNVPSWSISCEWFFYLLAPAAMFLIAGRKRRWLLLFTVGGYATVLGLLLWRNGSPYGRLYFVSWFAPSRFVEFLVGVAVAQLYLKFRSRKASRTGGLAQTAGLILFVAGAIYRNYAPWPLHGGLLYVPGAALLVYGLALGNSWLARHLSHRLLNRLGLTSFSLYLIHAPILRALKGVCFHFGWEVQSWPAFFATVTVMFLVAQTAAWIVYSSYEMPVQAWLRRWWRAGSATVVGSDGSALTQAQRA